MPCKRLLRSAVALAVFAFAAFVLIAPAASATTCNLGSVCFTNQGGNITSSGGTNPSITLDGVGSTLTTFYIGASNNLLDTSQMNKLTLTTGNLVTGSLETGAEFGQGGNVTIWVNNAVLFQGSFVGSQNWTVTGLITAMGKNGPTYTCNATTGCIYTLSGTIEGTYGPNGLGVAGGTVQQSFKTTKPWTTGSLALSGGNEFLVTPEPGSIGLMGTGLIGMGLIVRRRAKRDQV